MSNYNRKYQRATKPRPNREARRIEKQRIARLATAAADNLQRMIADIDEIPDLTLATENDCAPTDQ